MNKYYYAFSQYLKERFSEKVYRVSLDAGFTCPTRDGTKGKNGCAYCNEMGSWGGYKSKEDLAHQIENGKKIIRSRYKADKFIAYFQAYTNTYASVSILKNIYDSVLLNDKDFVCLSVGTRPDCIDEEKLELISSYRDRGLEVWIEYGLQTANDNTLKLVKRGHTSEDFRKAVLKTKKYGILTAAHVIIGLPEEKRDDVIYTAEFLNDLQIDGVKIHNLNIIKNTLIEDWFHKGMVKPLSLDEYADLVVDFLEHISPEVVVDRLIAQSSAEWLIEPKWSLNKVNALNEIMKKFKKRNSYQGKLYRG